MSLSNGRVMFPCHLSATFAFFFLMVLAVPAAHAVGFQPVSPDELKMTSEPQAPGAPAIILYRQVDRDDNDHNPHEEEYFRVKILTEEGREYANVEIPFNKKYEDIVNIKARTIKPNGLVVDFDGAVFAKTIEKAKGIKHLAKTFTLPDVQAGDIIEYYYTDDLNSDYIYDSGWTLSYELFTKDAKFSLKPFHNDLSLYNTIRWTWNYLPAGVSPPEQGPDKVVRLEVHNIPAFQSEDYAPPENELKSRVDFIYSEDFLPKNAGEFWKKTDKKLNGELESFIGKRKAMEEAVAQIISAGDSPELRLQKIYARVQQVHNTSYEIQKTEQEEKREKVKEAANVEEVWQRGYGNGKQLTWLFLALARAAGFEAYGMWASDRAHYFFNPQLLESNRLDANLVLVKLNGKDAYFDPGAAFTPFGLLPWIETGVPGLRLDKDGGSWIQTTLPVSSVSRIERKADLKLSQETGGLEGKLTVTYTGLEALDRRVEERNADDTGRKKYLEDEVKGFIPAGIEVELTNKPEWTSSAPSLVAEFDLKIPGWSSTAGKRALLPVGIFSAPEKHVFDHANREYAIYFEFPSQRVDDVTIELPAGWQVTSLPQAKNQDGHVIAYTARAENDHGKVHLARTLNVDFLLLDKKYYAALRSFFQQLRTSDEEQIVLQPGSTTAQN